MNAADIAREIRRQIPPERIARVIDQLPPTEREKIKRMFEPKPVKIIVRIKTRK